MPVMGTPMTREHVTDLMEKILKKMYFDNWAHVGDQYSDIYNVDSTKKKQETYVEVAGVGLFQKKAEGDQPAWDAPQQAFKVVLTVQTWELGIEITREAIEDNLYLDVGPIGKDLGRSGAYTVNVEAMRPFNEATSTTVYSAGGSNFTLLSTAHFRVDGQTWRNRPVTATDLSLEAFETALIDWDEQMVDQRGRKITPAPATLMVGMSDQFIAKRILMSDKRPFSNNNDPNIIKSDYDIRPKVAKHMTNDGRWFLMAPPEDTGLEFNWKVRQQMDRSDDPRTKNLLMVARYREGHGVTTPHGIYGSP